MRNGVSGGGKSTLIIETLYKAAAAKLNGSRQTPAKYERIEGLENFEKVIDIDQSPIGRTQDLTQLPIRVLLRILGIGLQAYLHQKQGAIYQDDFHSM